MNPIVQEAAYNAGLNKVINDRADGRPIHKYTARALRYSYTVQAIRSRIDVRSLMKLTGHEEIDTTLTYLQIVEQDTLEVGRAFKPFAATKE